MLAHSNTNWQECTRTLRVTSCSLNSPSCIMSSIFSMRVRRLLTSLQPGGPLAHRQLPKCVGDMQVERPLRFLQPPARIPSSTKSNGRKL